MPSPLVHHSSLTEFLFRQFDFGRNFKQPIGRIDLFAWGEFGHTFAEGFAFEHLREVGDEFLLFGVLFKGLLLFGNLHLTFKYNES